MQYTVHIEEVPEQPIAVLQGTATMENLIIRIRALFDGFYREFKEKGGLNVIYYPGPDFTGEFEIQCGVQMELGGNASTPAGTVATTTYMEPYDKMKPAHFAIHNWARENGRQLAGSSWEVYGHWNDDPAKLRTDIFYLLK